VFNNQKSQGAFGFGDIPDLCRPTRASTRDSRPGDSPDTKPSGRTAFPKGFFLGSSYTACPQNFHHRGIANPSAQPTRPGYLASTPLVLCLSSEIACRNRLQGNGPIQLTTDGFRPYLTAVEDAFGAEIDYAQLVKLY